MKNRSFNIAAMLFAVAAIAMFTIMPDAHAASLPLVVGGDIPHPTSFPQFAAEVGLALRLLGEKRTDLVARAAAKQGEIKEGLTPEQVRAIEDEHADLTRQIAEIDKETETLSRASSTPPTPPAPAANAPDPAAVTAAERSRITDIQRMASTHGIEAEVVGRAIEDGTSVEAFRGLVLDELAKKSQEGTGRGDRIQVSRDEAVTRRAAMATSILHRVHPDEVKLDDAAREYVGLQLLDVARQCLVNAGESVRGLSRSEIASRAFMSTSDFPAILADVANKSLRRGYDAYPRTFMPVASRMTLADFKTMNLVQMGEAPQLEKVNESGEFKRGSITEGKSTIKVLTYGKVVGITRQVIVNDDLGAFTRIPAMFGQAAATLESDIVWGIITANAAMADGVAIFHASHKNLASGAAFAVDGLSATRLLMTKQVGLDGKTRLNIRPRHVVLPPELETKAEQLLASMIVPAQSSNVTPASMRSLNIVVEPRLSDASATAYYTVADPSAVDGLAYAYLEGNEGVYTETRQGFDVDGMEVKVRQDFGAAMIDHRGWAKNPGA